MDFLFVKLCFVFGNGFYEKFIIESSKEKLTTFSSITVSLLLDQVNVIIDVKWFKNVDIGNSWKHLCEDFNCIGWDFILKWSEATKLMLYEKTFTISHSPKHILISDAFIEPKNVVFLEAKLRYWHWLLYLIFVFCKADEYAW